MDEYEWYDDDEPYEREPYVIVERRESAGSDRSSSGSRSALVWRFCWPPKR